MEVKYNRVVLAKELDDRFVDVGDVYEASDIFNGQWFLIRNDWTKADIAVISKMDFEEHFVQEDKFHGWTDWQPFIGGFGENSYEYKTNRKKVCVRNLVTGTRAEACCNKTDEFNLHTGIYIAWYRCAIKSLEKKGAKLREKLDEIDREVAENKWILNEYLNRLE